MNVEDTTEGLFHAMYEPDDFRRGLKEALAEAWDEGYGAAWGESYGGPHSAPTNPYREGEPDSHEWLGTDR